MKSLIEITRESMAARADDAAAAYAVFVDMCGTRPIRVPGMDTVCRLAVRLHTKGYSVQEAAAREYAYRWHLALQSRVFGVPHTIGM
ncbi:hypothetical protein [Mesorhizobium sp.]|uniref:hypothetical protein n=1 Tax=Mesorhizobium sp. TaxID=1871066 RepID=UPI000FE65A4F|nr:hypothetical protein [Mesorhizobium sp.]RWP29509.1 MAG: hypothetical protein EOR03_26650 [Mesorhizobium sp.]